MSEHNEPNTKSTLMEGIEYSPRRPIDADWSGKRKAIVTGVLVCVAGAAVAGGVLWALERRPPALPKTAEEAIAVINSDKFDRLDEERKRQYLSEAGRLTRELPEEQRRELYTQEDNRGAMREMWMQRMDDMARQMARGEEVEMPWGRRGGGDRQRPEMDADQRRQMRNRINSYLATQISSGNAQSTALRSEMWRSMRENRDP